MLRSPHRFARRSTLAVVIASALLAACGDDDEPAAENPPAAEETPAATATVTETPASPPVATDDDAEDALEAQEDQRAANLMAYFTRNGGTDRWSITEIDVDAGTVTVETNLFPDAASKRGFTGVCASLIDYAPWIERVDVEGQDDITHATWTKGDAACQTQGV